ncbi:MAG: pilin [Gammaproteobacteria bacterium]|nr:pilin [Gammaproteobacteria bacterium]
MKKNGFTLIELMIVVAIIGILASIAIPAYQDYTIRAQVTESFSITGELKLSIKEYYKEHGRFPANNFVAGVPAKNHLIGNYVTEVEVVDGAMHVTLGNYSNGHLHGQQLTIRPMFVSESPTSPISWTCGYREPPEGMETVGEDRTTLENKHLPGACR